MSKLDRTLLEGALWFLAAFLSVALGVVLSGCAQPPRRIEGNGKPTEPPPGWVDFCARNPQHETCRGRS